MNDTEYEIEYSKDKDAKVGHKTADTSFFGYKMRLLLVMVHILKKKILNIVKIII
ncbi:MAG: hypothetical protein HFJ50_10440 [Clostridia bacterium]|jgi:hypothetical protein|nr:hypothetical protein [Clostridia bacterium]